MTLIRRLFNKLLFAKPGATKHPVLAVRYITHDNKENIEAFFARHSLVDFEVARCGIMDNYVMLAVAFPSEDSNGYVEMQFGDWLVVDKRGCFVIPDALFNEYFIPKA